MEEELEKGTEEDVEKCKPAALTYSERKDRVVLVASLLAALVAAFSFIFKLIAPQFATFYITGIPFSIEQIIFAVLVGSGIVIFGSLLRYSYFEYSTFASYDDPEIVEQHVKKSNQAYLDSLKITKSCVSLSLIFIFLASCLVNYMVLWSLGIGLLLGVVEGGLDLWIKKKRSQTQRDLSSTTTWFRLVRKVPFKFMFFWLGATVATFIILLGMGGLTGKLDVTYTGQKTANVDMSFLNKEPGNVDVTVFHESDLNHGKKVTLEKKDFETSFTEVTIHRLGDAFINKLSTQTSDQVEFSESSYILRKRLDLTSYMKEGKNYIAITFESKYSSFEKKYRIINQVTKQGNTFTFTKDSSTINFR